MLPFSFSFRFRFSTYCRVCSCFNPCISWWSFQRLNSGRFFFERLKLRLIYSLLEWPTVTLVSWGLRCRRLSAFTDCYLLCHVCHWAWFNRVCVHFRFRNTFCQTCSLNRMSNSTDQCDLLPFTISDLDQNKCLYGWTVVIYTLYHIYIYIYK